MADKLDDIDFTGETGRSGYTDAYNDFMTKWNAGLSFIDIMLGLREMYPEDMVTTVLEDARAQGYI